MLRPVIVQRTLPVFCYADGMTAYLSKRQIRIDTDKADAVLAGSVGAAGFKVISAMRLVTQDGRILWTPNASGRTSSIVADHIVKELLKAAGSPPK